MGFLDDAKDAAETTGRKIGDWVEDTKDRIDDKADEARADAEVRKAEAERDRVEAKNEYNAKVRGDDD